MPERRTYPCPTCWTAVGFGQLRCAHCDRSLLYGLIAEPVDDARVRDKGAAELAAAPGGPTEAEARRRLSEGVPLIVGLTRETTERLQDGLVGAGIVARLGPAPTGTKPLEGGSETSGVGARVALAIGVPIVSIVLLLALQPAEEREASAAHGETVGAPPPTEIAELDISGAVELRRSSYDLVGIARARAPLETAADLELQLRDGPDGSMFHALLVPVTRDSQERGAVSFRESLRGVQLNGGEEIWLIATWGQLRSAPRPLLVPPRTPR